VQTDSQLANATVYIWLIFTDCRLSELNIQIPLTKLI